MPDYSKEMVEEQLLKAARYFGRALNEQPDEVNFFAATVGGVTIVVAIGDAGQTLQTALTVGKLLGEGTNIDHAKGPASVVLIPRFHAPPPEHASKGGHVHLHVLAAVKLDRRVRKSGEALCSKKRGSNERAPEAGETTMCPECVKLAGEYNLVWSLD